MSKTVGSMQNYIIPHSMRFFARKQALKASEFIDIDDLDKMIRVCSGKSIRYFVVNKQMAENFLFELRFLD